MKTVLFLSLVIALSSNLKAQSFDYSDIRDTIVMFSCNRVEKDVVLKTLEQLLNLDTTIISNNIHRYYGDVANCYYRIWAGKNDVNDAFTAINYHKKSINKKPDYGVAYWDIALIYYFLGDCANGDIYLGEYKKIVDEAEWDLDQIRQLKELCSNKK